MQRTLSGTVRLGVLQNFAKDSPPRALSSFTEEFAKIRIDVVVERSQFMFEILEKDDLDQVIAFNNDQLWPGTLLRRSEIVWLGKNGTALPPQDAIPQVVADGPCQFRKVALKALSDIGRGWAWRFIPQMCCMARGAVWRR